MLTMTSDSYVKFFLHRNEVTKCRAFGRVSDETYADPRISAILTELEGWPGRAITSHQSAGHPLHQLSFIAELGMDIREPRVGGIVRSIMANRSPEGPFQVLVNIPERYGGRGRPLMSWILCDAPLLTYAVIRLNQGKIDSASAGAVDHIAGLVSENGWRCTCSPELDGFRGPGKMSDPCPYATMWSLKMLSLTGRQEYSDAKEIGVATLLDLWSKRTETRPYLFAMGTDFKKLKLPFVWYDILNVADTLSRFEEGQSAPGFQEMLQIIQEKRTSGGYVPESVYQATKQWDFGQKKAPSPFMNAVVARIEKRSKP